MEMHQVRYFLAVARHLNFTRAADECHVAQPSLTRAIQKLEEELGGLLFHRERANTHLTELGRMMLPHLERTWQAADSARALATGLRKGTVAPLRLGIAASIATDALVGLMEGLKRSLNGLELSLAREPQRRVVESAMAGDLDLVFVSDLEDLPERMRGWHLFREECLLVLPQAHRLTREPIVALADLDNEDLIDVVDCPFCDRLRGLAADAGVRARFRHRAGAPDEMMRLVAAGFGLGLAPRALAPTEGLVGRLLAAPSFEHGVVIATVAGRPFSTATEACLRLARTRDWTIGRVAEAS